MGNRDKRDDKVRKPKKDVKASRSHVEAVDVPPPVEIVRKKRKPELFPDEE